MMKSVPTPSADHHKKSISMKVLNTYSIVVFKKAKLKSPSHKQRNF